MALDAGSVFVVLGGKFDETAFRRFEQNVAIAATKAEAFERRHAEVARRSAIAQRQIATAVKYSTAAIGVGLVGAMAYATKKAADFEAQMDAVGAASSASAKQLKALEEQAMKAGAATKFSALEAAQAQEELAKGGMRVTQILSGGLEGALALAAAGEMELAAAAKTTAQTLGQFGLQGSQATHVADALASAANSTTMDVADFAQALAQGGAAARVAGLSFDQTMVALQALAPSFASGSDMGTSLKAMLTQLARPTTQAGELMGELGIKVFDAAGKIKPLPALARTLQTAFADLTQEQKLQAATTLTGTDGMRALMALYGTSEEKLRRFAAQTRETGTAAEMAAKKTDNLPGKLEALIGSIETAAIKGGKRLQPMLKEGAEAAAEFVNELAASGDLDGVADAFADALRTTVEVIGNFVSVGGQVVGVIGDVAGALDDLVDLDDPGTITAILGSILAFKATSAVAPILMNLSGAIGELVLNARSAPTVAAFFRSLPVGGQIGLIATAVGTLTGALILLGDQESIEARLARQNAEAHREQAEAIKSVMDAEMAAADAGLAAKQAKLDLRQADLDLAAAADEFGKKSPEYERALLRQQQASLRAKASADAYTTSIRAQKTANDGRVAAATERLAEAEKELSDMERSASEREKTGASPRTDPAWIEARAEALANITARTKEYVQAVARSEVSELSRQRLMEASTQVTEQNALGISRLVKQLKDVPQNVKAKLLLEDQNALARAGTLAQVLAEMGKRKTVTKIVAESASARAMVLAFEAVVRGVPASKVTRILTTAPNAKAEVQALRREIDALRDKSVTVTTTMRQITQVESRRGRAAGTKTSGPELAWIGEGRDPVEWVIPRDPQYRGRAIGLLMDAAKNLLPGYKHGKKHGGAQPRPVAARVGGQSLVAPKTEKGWRDLVVPAAIAQGGVPFDRVQSDRDRIHGRYTDARDRATGLWRDLRRAQAELAAARKDTRTGSDGGFANASRRESLAQEIKRLERQHERAKAKLPGLETQNRLANRALAAARKVDERAKGLQSQINLQRDAMDAANRRRDPAGYSTARTERQARIKDLIDLLRGQLASVPSGKFSDYVRTLREQLSALGGPGALAGVVQGQPVPGLDPGALDGDYAAAGASSDAESDAARAAEEAAADARRQAEEAAREAAEKQRAISTGAQLSDDDQARLDAIERDLALAEVDTPFDDRQPDPKALEDDLREAERLTAFWNTVLGNMRAGAGAYTAATPPAVREAADALLSARAQVRDLAAKAVTGGATGNGAGALSNDEIARQARAQADSFGGSMRDLYREFSSGLGSPRLAQELHVHQDLGPGPQDPHQWAEGTRWFLESMTG